MARTKITALPLQADNVEEILATGDLTEARLGEAFARKYAQRLCFCHDTGRWFQWTDGAWREERRKLAFHWAVQLCKQANHRRNDAKWEKAATAEAVEKIARARPELAVINENFDGDTMLLGTPDGTVDLRTGRTKGADPADFISKMTTVAPEGGEPVGWLKFLDEVTGNDDGLIRFLRQWAGYCLTGDIREHALLFVYGPGGNGKSVFLNVISKILGDYALTAPMDLFVASHGEQHPTGIARLCGARMVTASETEEGRAWAEAKIKSITGGDRVAARLMRQNFFEFTPAFKLTIVGNHQPILRNVDDAARRRFNIVPFTRTPARPDKELEAKLIKEGGQILSWMIAGCLDWQANGLVRPTSVSDATRQYFDDQDIFQQWLDDKCRVEPDNNYLKEATTKLFESWSAFARENGEKPGSSRAFSTLLKRRGLTPVRTFKARQYAGIGLKSSFHIEC